MPTPVPRSQSQGSVFNCECQAIFRTLMRMAILNFSSGYAIFRSLQPVDE
jgi:hypothetical protein